MVGGLPIFRSYLVTWGMGGKDMAYYYWRTWIVYKINSKLL